MKSTGPDGAPGISASVFQIYFVVLFAGVGVLMIWVRQLQEDTSRPVEPLLTGRELLRPFRAAASLVNLVDPRKVRRRTGGAPGDKKD